MRPPARSNAVTPYAAAKGSITIQCPKCGASAGWSCVQNAYDEEGRPYVTRRLKRNHKERREAV